MTVNPLDPFGLVAAATRSMERIAAQQREALRQAKLNAARADVDTAYLAFRNHPDTKSAQNLCDAATAYLSVAAGE